MVNKITQFFDQNLSALINCATAAGKSNTELILKAGLKMLARGKHSSLLDPVICHKEKNVLNTNIGE
jgi:hypothetical protein